MKIDWEDISPNTTGTMFRAKVPNGWLYKEVSISDESRTPVIVTIVDSEHKWGEQETKVDKVEELWIDRNHCDWTFVEDPIENKISCRMIHKPSKVRAQGSGTTQREAIDNALKQLKLAVAAHIRNSHV